VGRGGRLRDSESPAGDVLGQLDRTSRGIGLRVTVPLRGTQSRIVLFTVGSPRIVLSTVGSPYGWESWEGDQPLGRVQRLPRGAVGLGVLLRVADPLFRVCCCGSLIQGAARATGEAGPLVPDP
jgi:hypothetical protein